MGRNEEEMQKIKTILEARKVPGARVLRDQLYPIKADSMNRMAVFDQEFNVLPGAMETLSQENEVQIAKVAWLSRKVNPKLWIHGGPHPFVKPKKKEDHQKWTTSLVNNSAKMRDMCKMSHLTIANNYLYWNLGLLISRPDRVPLILTLARLNRQIPPRQTHFESPLQDLVPPSSSSLSSAEPILPLGWQSSAYAPLLSVVEPQSPWLSRCTVSASLVFCSTQDREFDGSSVEYRPSQDTA
ncbi:Uncharacterized protein HZ326_27541 [Fusarium oxysporum f. sp. albedinis]|nr:Uncharacterized protein HZ326_27541 [Fusarium oxysporum f. sp. albedinis]